MRVGPFYENLKLALFWALACFCIFDEEPVWDFSDWNLTQATLLTLGLFAIV